jgi:hypothetical protein
VLWGFGQDEDWECLVFPNRFAKKTSLITMGFTKLLCCDTIRTADIFNIHKWIAQMTEDERERLLKRIETRILETKTFSRERALNQLKEEGFCIQDGKLEMKSYKQIQP